MWKKESQWSATPGFNTASNTIRFGFEQPARISLNLS